MWTGFFHLSKVTTWNIKSILFLYFSCWYFLNFLSNQTGQFIKQKKICNLDKEYNSEILKKNDKMHLEREREMGF